MAWKAWLTWLVVLGAPLLGAWLWYRLLASQRGEAYLKQRMQGPFVPVDEEEK